MFGLGMQEIAFLLGIICILGLVIAPSYCKKKLTGVGGGKSRLAIGSAQFILSTAVYAWTSAHAPSSVYATWILSQEIYVLLIVAVAIYALLGIGNMVIGILNSAAEKKSS